MKTNKENFWGLSDEQIHIIETTGNFDTGRHWNFWKISNNEYEAIYDGLYMHVFSSLEDFLARENETSSFEYDTKLSRGLYEETFTDVNGNIRN